MKQRYRKKIHPTKKERVLARLTIALAVVDQLETLVTMKEYLPSLTYVRSQIQEAATTIHLMVDSSGFSPQKIQRRVDFILDKVYTLDCSGEDQVSEPEQHSDIYLVTVLDYLTADILKDITNKHIIEIVNPIRETAQYLDSVFTKVKRPDDLDDSASDFVYRIYEKLGEVWL